MASKILRNLLILLFCLYIAAFSLMYILLPKADFSEKLFEQQSIIAPDIDTRVAALEEMMATIIYGGEIYAQ